MDPRGETEWDNRVKHAHLVENSLFKDEFEYLFAPYSVFTVRKFSAPAAVGPDSGTPVDPYVVDLDAATDHVGLPENQPVSTWA